jgi:amidase
MNFEDYQAHDALALAGLIRGGAVSRDEVKAAATAAVERLNPSLNAVIETFDDEPTADDGVFAGVPFLVKDLVLHRRGGLVEMGSRFARGLRTPDDTFLMERFRAAGLVAIGRTNTPEFGHGCTTEPVANGPTRNPWNPAHMAGGSSGGSAAAVAAGMVPIAHGNDGAGSLRNPAACCGVFALKPSRGRITLGPDSGDALFGMGCEGVLSRSVRDSAAALDAVAGPAAGDPYVIAPPHAPYRQEVDRDPAPLRIAVTTDAWSGAPIGEESRAATWQAARLCEALGHHVEEARPAFDYAEYRRANIDAWAAGMVSWVDGLAAINGRVPGDDNLEAATLAIYRHGKALSAGELLAVPAVMNRISRAVGGFFETYDLLLTPVTATPAAPLGTYDQNAPGITPERWFDHKGSFTPFLALFNLTGQPAMSVPLCHSADGLPLGVQFAAGFGREDLLFRLAGQLERALPWASRRPPLRP